MENAETALVSAISLERMPSPESARWRVQRETLSSISTDLLALSLSSGVTGTIYFLQAMVKLAGLTWKVLG